MLRLGTPPASTPTRLAALLLAGLSCFGPLVTSLHEAAMLHARCLVHPGEIVHVRAAPAAAPWEAPSAAGEPRHETGDAHEHCDLGPPRAPRPEPYLAAAARLAAAAPSDAAAPRRTAQPRWPVYRLAPKSSPPDSSSS